MWVRLKGRFDMGKFEFLWRKISMTYFRLTRRTVLPTNDTLSSRFSIIVYHTKRQHKNIIVKVEVDARCVIRVFLSPLLPPFLQIDGVLWLDGWRQTEAILLTFSNLINLLLIEDHRHIYNITMFVSRNKWINFISYHPLHLRYRREMNKNYMHDIDRKSQLTVDKSRVKLLIVIGYWSWYDDE